MMIPPVSKAEMERILDITGNKKKHTVFNTRLNSRFYVQQMLNLFPGMESAVLEAFPENQTHIELKTVDNACTLLGTDGCTLPREARPYFCRIYPFWFFEEDPLIFQDSQCLALQNNQSIPEVFLSLGTNLDTLKQVHSMICQDWGLIPSLSPAKVKLSL